MKSFLKALLWVTGGLLAICLIGIAILYTPDKPVEELKEKYAQGASRFAAIKNMQVHYRDEGPPTDSIPLVLLHGTGAFLQTWDACTAEWVKTRRVIRMDLPGFGLTGPSPGDDYSIAAYVDFLHAFLQELQVGVCYLAGNSLGGQIAWAYAEAYPQQVKKLILLDPAGYPIEGAKGNLAFNLARIPVVNQLLTIVTPLSVVRKSVEDSYGNKERVTDAVVHLYRDMACRQGNRRALVIRLNQKQSGDTALIAGLAQPTLIVWGDLDGIIPPDHAYRFSRDLANDSLVMMPGVGHIPMEEAPAQVAALVSAWLR